MPYCCLVLDHDDTVVKSTVQIHYPAYLHTMAILRPEVEPLSCVEFQEACAHPGLMELYQKTYGFTDEEMAFELADWKNYVKDKIPDAFSGMKEVLAAFHRAGGTLCVISHSDQKLICRDYLHHFGFAPHFIYDLAFTPNKPSPAPLLALMAQTGLDREQLLVVDDLPIGKQMADAAGVDFAYAGWCPNPPSLARQMNQLCQKALTHPRQLMPLLGLA